MIVKKYHKIFRKDPCTNARTRGKNVRAHVSSRQNARAHVYASCARVCARILTKNVVVFFYYLMNVSVKFQKDPSFCCGDICKTIMTFKNHQFSIYFAFFTVLHLQSLQSWIIRGAIKILNVPKFWKKSIIFLLPPPMIK